MYDGAYVALAEILDATLLVSPASSMGPLDLSFANSMGPPFRQ
jgi:hypothetical protein